MLRSLVGSEMCIRDRNLPSDISEEMVAKVYKTAWEWGCKGITVYRDGSRTGVLVSADSPEKGGKMMKSMPKERPVELEAEVVRFKNANEQWIAFVGPVSYTHLRAHETPEHLVCRLLLEKKNHQSQ